MWERFEEFTFNLLGKLALIGIWFVLLFAAFLILGAIFGVFPAPSTHVLPEVPR